MNTGARKNALKQKVRTRNRIEPSLSVNIEKLYSVLKDGKIDDIRTRGTHGGKQPFCLVTREEARRGRVSGLEYRNE